MIGWLAGGSLLTVLGLCVAVHTSLSSETGWARTALGAYERRMEQHASSLMLPWSGRRLAHIHVAGVLACAVLALATRSPAIAGALAVLVAGPVAFLRKLRQRRLAKLERQLDGWLLILANALKSTPSVGDAIASTAQLVPRPFSEEIDLLVKEIHLGMPLDRALGACSRRIGSGVVSGALMMVVVARQTGGDLSITLERVSSALRETARLEGVLRAKTAEGRGQVAVLAAVPFLLCTLISWLDPTWFDPMLQHAYGRGILATCAAAWLAATLWAHQIAGTRL